MNIYLVGYRCSGKTTIGKALAIKIKRSFLDTDEIIVDQCKITINEIIGKYGWKYFRSKENEVIRNISSENSQIVATGGGTVVNDKNVILMKKSGILVWLQADKENIKRWILSDNKTLKNRPSLTGKNLMCDIEQTFSFRNEIYNSVCDFVVPVDTFNISSICDCISYNVSRILLTKKACIN